MKFYLVGGAVRDGILGLPIIDRDWLVVGGTAQVMETEGFTPVGKDFPVYLHPETREEYALARTERKSGRGYKGFAVSALPTTTLEEDLARRDLTINAMAQDEAGNLFDPYHGLSDLNDRLLRHVSPAFAEDPLRVLRVARFAARFASLGFRIAPETLTLMRQMTTEGELAYLVTERIWQETWRALSEPTPWVYIETLQACGAFSVLFPEWEHAFAQPLWQDPQSVVEQHTRTTLSQLPSGDPHPQLVFALLCQSMGLGTTGLTQASEATEKLCQRIRAPNRQTQLAVVCAAHVRTCHNLANTPAADILSLLLTLGVFRTEPLMADFLVCCRCDFSAYPGQEQVHYVQASWLVSCAKACLAVNATPFLAQGFLGPDIGRQMTLARIDAIQQEKTLWVVS